MQVNICDVSRIWDSRVLTFEYFRWVLTVFLKNSGGSSKVLVSNYNLLRTWYWMQLVLYSPVASLTLAAFISNNLLPILICDINRYHHEVLPPSFQKKGARKPRKVPRWNPEQMELCLLTRSHCSLNDSSTCSRTSKETYKKNKQMKITPTLRTT